VEATEKNEKKKHNESPEMMSLKAIIPKDIPAAQTVDG